MCDFQDYRTLSKALRQLPRHVQEQTKEAYLQFSVDPQHPSLQFKQFIQADRSSQLE